MRIVLPLYSGIYQLTEHGLRAKTSEFINRTSLMNIYKKVERGLTVLAIAPFVGLERKERDRRLQERIKRLEQKQKQ
jgi:hypothetical protein